MKNHDAHSGSSLPRTAACRRSSKDTAALRASAGVGVTWKSPVGPIRLDLAYPIKKKSFDKTQIFHVSFGTRF